jgi:hypothetical protein
MGMRREVFEAAGVVHKGGSLTTMRLVACAGPIPGRVRAAAPRLPAAR